MLYFVAMLYFAMCWPWVKYQISVWRFKREVKKLELPK